MTIAKWRVVEPLDSSPANLFHAISHFLPEEKTPAELSRCFFSEEKMPAELS